MGSWIWYTSRKLIKKINWSSKIFQKSHFLSIWKQFFASSKMKFSMWHSVWIVNMLLVVQLMGNQKYFMSLRKERLVTWKVISTLKYLKFNFRQMAIVSLQLQPIKHWSKLIATGTKVKISLSIVPLLKKLRIWDAKTGFLIQTLEGHTDDIFAASFSYDGTTIITASKDNTCRVWRWSEIFNDNSKHFIFLKNRLYILLLCLPIINQPGTVQRFLIHYYRAL